MTDVSSRSRVTPATATGPSLWWRLVWSSWLLLLLVPAGGVAWLAFGLLAGIARRRSWGISAGVYALAAIVVQAPDDPAGRIMQGSLYLVALVHGLIINQSWLLVIWGRRENGLNPMGIQERPAAQRTRRTRRGATRPPEAAALLDGAGTARSDYIDEAAPAPRTPRARAAATPQTPAEPVDVNTANQRTLARLTGMDRARAKTVVAARAKRGGFASLEDFAGTAGLQPHELVRLRGEAFCSPRPRAKRSFGRRVDY